MKKWIWVLSLVAIVALTGCIKMEQDITLNKDGSGNVKFVCGKSEQTIKHMEAMSQKNKSEDGAEADDDNPFEFNEEEIKKEFEAMQDQGITLNSVKTTKEDGWQYMNIDFDFEDVTKLDDTSDFENVTIMKNADGNYVISSKMGSDYMGGDEGAELMCEYLIPVLSGMRIAIKINTPNAIISTTAPIKSKDSAEWVFDVDKDPDSFLNMSKTDMEVVFGGDGCTIPEIK
jgi:hypothetical protein